jgi:hypothetical protein
MPLAPSDVIARLAAAVEPRKFWRFGGGQRPFEGEVSATSFRIRRIITYRNSFLPVIRGDVVPEGRGSRLAASLTLHPSVIVFLVIWSALLVIIGAGVWARALASDAWNGEAFMPLGLLAFAWVLTSASFTFEARKPRTLLTEVLVGAARPSSVDSPAAELPVATVRRDV